MEKQTTQQLAEIVYNMLGIYGEYIQEAPTRWKDLDEDEKQDFLEVVNYIHENESEKPETLQGLWMQNWKRRGWTAGVKYDESKKQAPWVAPYMRLDDKQRRKMHFVKALVLTLTKSV